MEQKCSDSSFMRAKYKAIKTSLLQWLLLYRAWLSKHHLSSTPLFVRVLNSCFVCVCVRVCVHDYRFMSALVFFCRGWRIRSLQRLRQLAALCLSDTAVWPNPVKDTQKVAAPFLIYFNYFYLFVMSWPLAGGHRTGDLSLVRRSYIQTNEHRRVHTMPQTCKQ